jgi:hypothetical protein
LFQRKKVMDEATKKGLKANERVVPESDAKKLKARIRELERMLGKQTMKLEILEEWSRSRRKKGGSRAGTRPAKTVDSDGLSRAPSGSRGRISLRRSTRSRSRKRHGSSPTTPYSSNASRQSSKHALPAATVA